MDCQESDLHEEVAIRSTGTLEERVSALLLQLRVPVHLSGYRFIRQAILLALAEPTLLDCVTYALYPAVAARYGTSASCVERAIRHAITVAGIEAVPACFRELCAATWKAGTSRLTVNCFHSWSKHCATAIIPEHRFAYAHKNHPYMQTFC